MSFYEKVPGLGHLEFLKVVKLFGFELCVICWRVNLYEIVGVFNANVVCSIQSASIAADSKDKVTLREKKTNKTMEKL